MLKRIFIIQLIVGYLFVPGACAAQVQKIEGLTVAFLSGSPYEIGRQHGSLLREEVQASVSGVLRYFRRYLKIPWVRSLLVNG